MASADLNHWSTLSVRPGERFDFWREVVCDTFVELAPQKLKSGPFHGEVGASWAGEIGVARIRASAQKVVRSQREISRARMPCHFLNIQLEGSGLTRQGKQEHVLVPGDMVLVDASRPFDMTFNDSFCQMSLTIPDELVKQLLNKSGGDLAGLFISGNRPEARLLRGYGELVQQALADHRPESGLDDTPDLMARQITEIFQQVVHPARSQTSLQGINWRGNLLANIKAAVRINPGDPDHTPQQAAAKAGISVRLLHKLFAENGESFGRWLLAERLQAAAKMLRSPDYRQAGIAGIAFDNGFADQSHFGRAFKTKYKLTPRQYRNKYGPD